MKTQATLFPSLKVGVGVIALGTFMLMGYSAQAQLIPNLVNGSNPVLDEYGRPLSQSGRALVQVLLVGTGIQPPAKDGMPHNANPVMYTGHIGQGIVPDPEYDGQFALMVTPRVASTFFIRAFNRVAVDQSSFYADSQTFTPSMDVRFVPVFGPMQELDPDDDDGDGLSNSWEKSLGTDAWMADTDGDGISDYDEFLAGTDLLDNTLFLQMVKVMPVGDGMVRVWWESVSNRHYQVQMAEGLADDVVFVDVNEVVVASGHEAEITVTNAPGTARQHFRVKLVE